MPQEVSGSASYSFLHVGQAAGWQGDARAGDTRDYIEKYQPRLSNYEVLPSQRRASNELGD
jgi:hypothetical protein